MKENKMTNEGIELIKHFEGIPGSGKPFLNPYLCPAGRLTIGWGHTGKDVKDGIRIDEAEAQRFLFLDILVAANCIKKNVKVELTDNQFSALVSWIFNLGCGNFMLSTLQKVINKKDWLACRYEIARWNKAINPNSGKLEPLEGLRRRRNAEVLLFMKGLT